MFRLIVACILITDCHNVSQDGMVSTRSIVHHLRSPVFRLLVFEYSLLRSRIRIRKTLAALCILFVTLKLMRISEASNGDVNQLEARQRKKWPSSVYYNDVKNTPKNGYHKQNAHLHNKQLL